MAEDGSGILSRPRVIVLGGGPAGTGAAYRLRALDRADVVLVERNPGFGGCAGSFELAGQHVDYGSHRLHPSCDPAILADLRGLLGEDLLERPRHGRIRLRGRWVRFPPRPVDLLRNADSAFLAGAAKDAALGPWRRFRCEDVDDSFASLLERELGPTLSEDLYFPFARKIWGREPETLAAEQARRRVSARSPGLLARKLLGRIPGVRPVGFDHFLYPRRGYGQISEALAEAARDAGARLLTGWTAVRADPPGGPGESWSVEVRRDGERRVLEGDLLWSTVPITTLTKIVSSAVEERVGEAAASLEYRAMTLVYLVVPATRFSEFDAHYLPDEALLATRISEPKNYAGRVKPIMSTVLCAEVPCAYGDAVWTASPEALGERIAADLDRIGIPLPAPPLDVETRRIRHAYPIYTRDYEAAFEILDAWAGTLPRLLVFGRQGLFAHDNAHHAFAMAYRAVDCLSGEGFDEEAWAGHRETFRSHVVED